MRRLGHILLAILIGILIAASVAVWFFGGYLQAVVGYSHTPANAKAIGEQAKFNTLGKRYYYASSPRIVTKPEIQKSCAAVASEGLLGCYTGKIYLLDVENPEFKPEMTVTGAHEMLHAAYTGYSPKERQRVEGLLAAELEKRKDPKLNERVKKYQDQESQLDEAFAILGSEAPNESLSPELQREFNKYFTDRGEVVTINRQFQSAFDDLEAKVSDLNAQLELRKQQLDGLLAEDAIEAYNAQVGPYNELVRQHNELVTQYNDLGERFNRAIGNGSESVQQR